jgi:N-acetylglucosamine-6-phosphate deacetylase
MTTLIRQARIVGPRRVTQGNLLLSGGRIARIGAGLAAGGAEIVDGKGLLALPGFIDLHTHGGLGFDLTEGMYNASTGTFDASAGSYRAGLPMLAARFARSGVTRALLGTFAAPMPQLRRALSRLADYIEDPRNGSDGARIEGGCLEGTFLRHAAMAGAQAPRHFRKPERRVIDSLLRASRGTMRYVNLVPEFGEVSVRMTRYLTERGVLVGAGHTNCPADQVAECMRAGLKIIVHFLNGPTGSSPKPFHGGNVAEAALRSDIHVELICDGWHVAPAYVRDVIARKGLDRVVLVTDAMFLAGAKGIRSFSLGGKEGVVHPSGEYLQVKADPNTLFGSVLDMATAFGNLLSWLTRDMEGVWRARHKAMATDEALPALARCAATNAARLLGWDRATPGAPKGVGTGSLERGKAADVVLGRLSGKSGAYWFKPKHVFVAGRKVVWNERGLNDE